MDINCVTSLQEIVEGRVHKKKNKRARKRAYDESNENEGQQVYSTFNRWIFELSQLLFTYNHLFGILIFSGEKIYSIRRYDTVIQTGKIIYSYSRKVERRKRQGSQTQQTNSQVKTVEQEVDQAVRRASTRDG